VLWRVFEVTGEWSDMPTGELHNLYSLADIIWQINSKRIRWTRPVLRMGEGRNM
jgi:hypothetical protein